MKLYRLANDKEQYGLLVMDGKILLTSLGRNILLNANLLSENIGDKWPELSTWFHPYDNNEVIENMPDLYLTKHQWLILSDRAKKLLEPELRKIGEYLPITCLKEPYYLLVPHNIVSVNKKKSEHFYIQGERLGTQKVVFRDEDVGMHILFKTDFDFGVNLFCSEKFKKLVEKRQLKGLFFETELANTPYTTV